MPSDELELVRKVARAIRDAAGGSNIAQAEAALKAYDEWLESNDKLIVDRKVPGVTGAALAEDVEERRKENPFLPWRIEPPRW